MKQYTQTEFKKNGATYKNISSPNGQITDLKQVNDILVSSTDNGATFAPIKVAVVNNLTSNDGTVPLAAAQGKVLNTSVTNNTNLVVAETTARVDADNALQNNINTEETARQNADETLQSNIESETTNRTTADNAIKADLATETTNRQNADTTLQSNITAEETARKNADTALQNALNTESANAVKVIAQTFTTAQQAQARTNIGAGTSSFNGAYSALTGKPILNTTNTAAQATNSSETINGTINLHKISKTGTFSDLRNIPTATTGVAGIVNLATDQESATGTNATKAITPKQLKTAIEGLGTVFDFKGSVATVADLPQTGNTVGDVWYVIAQSVGYIWLNDGTTNRWEQFGATIDLSGYMQYTDIVNNLTSTATNKVLSAYQGKVLNDSKATVTALTAETTARAAADTTLQTNINNEQTARTTADNALQNNINGKQDKVQGIAFSSGDNPTIELGRTDGVIGTPFIGFHTDGSSATGFNSGVFADGNNLWVDTPKGAFIVNGLDILAKLNDKAIKADLATETTNRQNADTTLQSNITAEETARIDADNALQNDIDTETNARADADAALQTNINAKYTKPAAGIPKTDLAVTVQTSLTKADDAVTSTQLNNAIQAAIQNTWNGEY